MALRFIGTDPFTDGANCPTVWVDELTNDLVLQGWKADETTEAECRESGDIPAHEAVVRLPARMISLIRKACDDAERPQL